MGDGEMMDGRSWVTDVDSIRCSPEGATVSSLVARVENEPVAKLGKL